MTGLYSLSGMSSTLGVRFRSDPNVSRGRVGFRMTAGSPERYGGGGGRYSRAVIKAGKGAPVVVVARPGLLHGGDRAARGTHSDRGVTQRFEKSVTPSRREDLRRGSVAASVAEDGGSRDLGQKLSLLWTRWPVASTNSLQQCRARVWCYFCDFPYRRSNVR